MTITVVAVSGNQILWAASMKVESLLFAALAAAMFTCDMNLPDDVEFLYCNPDGLMLVGGGNEEMTVVE